MRDDDELPAIQARRVPPLALDKFDIAELEAYIGELKAEIIRAEAAIAAKDTHRSAAEAFFRWPGG